MRLVCSIAPLTDLASAPPYDAPPAHSSDAATAPLVPNASDEKEQLRRKYAAEGEHV
jgi:hypothetical protein